PARSQAAAAGAAVAAKADPRRGGDRPGVTLIVGLVAGRALLLPRYRFPPPSGPFGIGTSTLHLVDTERAELLGPNLEAPRELMVQFWYPTERDNAGRGQYLRSEEHTSELQ